MAKTNCLICGKELGVMSGKVKCADGYVCNTCFHQAGFIPGNLGMISAARAMTVQQLQEAGKKKQNDLAVIKSFDPTYVPSKAAQFDDNSRQMILSPFKHMVYMPEHYTLFSYDQLIDFELLEDGQTTARGGLGQAVAGGVLFGSMGAVVGGVTAKRKTEKTCTKLQIKLTLKGYSEPAFYINLITSDTLRNSLAYRRITQEAQDITAQLQVIIHSLEQAAREQYAAAAPEMDPPDLIRKYKALLDDGIITEEEFEAKKKELLAL